MSADKYIKIDGVHISREWVNGMTKNQFINHPQVNGLFYRIKPTEKASALSSIYETITGKKSKNGGNAPAPEVVKEETPVNDQPEVSEINERGE